MADRDAVAGDVTVSRMPLRFGGWIGYDDEAIYVDRDDQTVRIRHGDVSRVVLRRFEWDLLVMNALLIGVGGFVFLTRNPLVGLGFGAIGMASAYWTYRKRYELVVRVEDEPRPVSVHPSDPIECHETLAGLIEDDGNGDGPHDTRPES